MLEFVLWFETISENSGLTDKRISEESPDSYLELENLAEDIKATITDHTAALKNWICAVVITAAAQP